MPSKQAPIHSGFGPTTTAQETIDGISEELTGVKILLLVESCDVHAGTNWA